MALPLAMIVALPGTWAGFQLALKAKSKTSALVSLIAVLLLPSLMGFEQRLEETPATRIVVSSISIEAPIEDVWKQVIAFDRISAPPQGIFRLGVAYPLEARIEGSGVGAMRYCVFSTGAFVEPITEWSEPHTLAFDVIENPPVMEELSIYKNLDTPQLHGTFESTRGQFSLRQDGRSTILEGTTWYRQKLYPDWYWHPISDEIVHRIHLRVLDHIKLEAEAGTEGL